MKRLFRTKFFYSGLLPILLIAGSLGLHSCEPPAVGYQTQNFATLRAMNFSGFCLPAQDIYWDPSSVPVPSRDTQAKAYRVNFGQASVYTTGIQTGMTGTTYDLVARPTGEAIQLGFSASPKSRERKNVLLQPGKKYTWLLSSDNAIAGVDLDTIIEDAPFNPTASDTAYIRFINEMPGTPNLSVMVNDPNSSLSLTPPLGVQFNAAGAYFPLHVQQDVGVTYFVVNTATHAVVARLANQTPVGKQFYTLVYSGDLCRTPLQNPDDTTFDKQDTLRLRTFDDNIAGNDLTVPVPSSMRYNIINGIVDSPYHYGAVTPDSTTSADTELGFVFNTLALPAKHNFSIDPVPPLAPGGASVTNGGTTTGGNPVYNVAFQNADLPAKVDVRLFATDGVSDAHTYQIFDYSDISTLSSSKTVKLTSDHSYTFIWGDSITIPGKGKSTPQFDAAFLTVPDVSYDTAARLIFIPGIVGSAHLSLYYSSFWYSVNGGTAIPSFLNGLGGGLGHSDATIVIPVAKGQSVPVTITTKIGPPKKPTQIVGPSDTFNAEAGGIYEVVTVGRRDNAKLLIIRVNP